MDTADKARALAALTLETARYKAAADVIRDDIEAEFTDAYRDTGERRRVVLDDVVEVRLDKPTRGAAVTDRPAFDAWVEENHPTEVTLTIVVPAAAADDALNALEFAGVSPVEDPRRGVRPTFEAAILKGVDFTDEAGAPVAVLVDKDTGAAETVEGVAPTLGRPVFKVIPAKGTKDAAAVHGAAAATALLKSGAPLALGAVTLTPTGDAPDVDAEDTSGPIPDDLTPYTVPQLKAIAAAHGVKGGRNRRDVIDALTEHATDCTCEETTP